MENDVTEMAYNYRMLFLGRKFGILCPVLFVH